MDFENCENGIQEYVYKDIQDKIAELELKIQKREGNKMLDM